MAGERRLLLLIGSSFLCTAAGSPAGDASTRAASGG